MQGYQQRSQKAKSLIPVLSATITPAAQLQQYTVNDYRFNHVHAGSIELVLELLDFLETYDHAGYRPWTSKFCKS
jgi:hypothetical protein